MAGETILVVGGAPVNLTLTGILLRREGYEVHSAQDAEQALALLRNLHPDLMLVDAGLSGADGLELTRAVKQDARTCDIVVVALTEGSGQGEAEAALQAGCDGHIAKPIEALTLARSIRECLDRRKASPEAGAAASEKPAFPAGIALTGPEMEGVRRRFLADAAIQTHQMLQRLDRGIDVAGALRSVREWADAAAVLGYPAVAVVAREVEKQLRAPQLDAGALAEALSHLTLGLVEPPEASIGPIPDFIVRSLAGKRVALVGFAAEEAENLCGALERASARPRLFDAAVVDSDAIGDCSVVMVRAGVETQGSFLLGPGSAGVSQRRLILAGMRDQILALDDSVRSRASEFLIDGWQPEEALMRLAFALARREPAPAAPAPVAVQPAPEQNLIRDGEVLVADDDLTVRLLVRAALQGAGIKCSLAANGNEALQMLRDCRPAVCVLDINMPGMDGFEVLAAVRGEGIPVRVLLLTARQQEADITRGFKLGADDYIVKPFNPEELLARVRRFLR